MRTNAFKFKVWNDNFVVRVDGTVPEALVNGDLIYVDTSGVPQLLDDTANVTAIYMVAEDAAASDLYVVAYPIKHDDQIVGKLASSIYSGLNVNGDHCGLLDEDNQYLDVDATNKYFTIFNTYDNDPVLTTLTSTVTVVTGGAALAAGDLFSLDAESKTTKTLGDVVYVASEAYESGTSVTVKVYTYDVVAQLDI